MKRILLTGGRAPATLDLARHFHNAGHVVFVAESVRYPICRGSRSIKELIMVPPPRTEHRAFTQALCRIVKENQIDLLVPTCEEVFYVSRHLDHLRKHVQVFCAEFQTLEALHNKWSFSQTGAMSTVRTPKTDLIRSMNDIDQSVADRSVYKPVYSRFASKTLISPTDKKLERITPSDGFPWIRQDRIEGNEFCTFSVVQEGTMKAFSCYRPTHRAGQSSGFYFEPVQHPDIENYVKEFVAHHNFTGHIGFDFIEDQDGQLYVLECNPRLTSGVHLYGLGSGLTGALLGDADAPAPKPNTQPSMLALAMVLIGLPQAAVSLSLRKMLSDFGRASDVVSRPGDRYPGTGQIISLGYYLMRSLALGISPMDASTRDIEWDGEVLDDY